jgi:hypothetical protein
VGYGEFNLAWTLTPFPGRPIAFFDHTHNLPLQLAGGAGPAAGCAVLGCCWQRLALHGALAWRAPAPTRCHGAARR